MLKRLYINNFLLIDVLQLELEKGLVAITGETGAGKSIILGALKLVLGDRLAKNQLTEATKKCTIEAGFTNYNSTEINKILSENNIEVWDELILRREISPNGISRNFVNDSPVKLEVLKEIQIHTIDIHSQFNNQQIHLEDFHRKTIDSIAKNDELLEVFKNNFRNQQKRKKEIAELENNISKEAENRDYIHFLLDEFDKISLKNPNEQAELENEIYKLENVENLLANLAESKQLIENESFGLIVQLFQLQNSLEKSKNIDELVELSNRTKSIKIELEDIQQEVEKLLENVEVNPERLEEKKERLSEIYRLQKKHQANSIEELIAIQDEFSKKISNNQSLDEKLNQLKKEFDAAKSELQLSAKEISERRKSVLGLLKTKILESLLLLGMPDAKIEYEMENLSEPNEYGSDKISLLFSANKGISMQNLENNISGGEKSRLMFAIKKTLAEYQALPCIVFDEIDTGISGKVAHEMALLMKEMSKSVQLIVITHLPQIAAKGDSQYKVIKENNENVVNTQIIQLDNSSRVEEVAQMLSGTEITEEAIAQAKKLLDLN